MEYFGKLGIALMLENQLKFILKKIIVTALSHAAEAPQHNWLQLLCHDVLPENQ